MKQTREFEIAWQGLKPGPHTYIYDIDNRFMVGREVSDDFKNWNAKITLSFDKHESFFILNFDIDGVVTVPCDRCGDEFDLKLWDEFVLIIKLTGEDAEKIDEEDDVVFLPRTETVIDISNWLYEFLMLSIPIQHIHPDVDGNTGCNKEAISLLNKLSEVIGVPAANPIWKGLDAFKEIKSKKTRNLTKNVRK